MNFSILLKAKEPHSSTLAEAIASINLAVTAQTVADISAVRKVALLEGEVDLSDLDRQLAEAEVEHERAIALKEALSSRLEAALYRERLDALSTEKSSLEKEIKAASTILDTKFRDSLDTVCGIVRTVDAIEPKIMALNARLADAGSTERLHFAEPAALADLLVCARRLNYSVGFANGGARA